MSTMTAPPKRSLDTAAQNKNNIPAEFKKLAKEFYFANKEANAASNKSGKARKALFAGMLDVGIRAFGFRATQDGDAVDLQVEIAEGRCTSKVNIEKLRKLLNDDEKLIQFVSMTKTAVVENFGSIMADQVCETFPGTETVKVGPKK